MVLCSGYQYSGPILESKGMHAIFQKNGKKGENRAKYLKIWAKMYHIWKYFEKGQLHACDYRMHETAGICPATTQLNLIKPELRRFKSCSRHIRDSWWWGSLTIILAGNKAKRLSLVNHITKTIHHLHHHQMFDRVPNGLSVILSQKNIQFPI